MLRDPLGLFNVRQKDIKIRAARSHSLSSVAGAYDSLPDFDDVLSLLTDEGILSAQPRTLSRLVLPPDPVLFLLRSQDGSKAETRCILQMQVYSLGVASIMRAGLSSISIGVGCLMGTQVGKLEKLLCEEGPSQSRTRSGLHREWRFQDWREGGMIKSGARIPRIVTFGPAGT